MATVGVSPISTSSPSSSSAAAATVATSSHSSATSQPQSSTASDKTVAIGVGVGLGAGIPLCVALVAGLIYFSRRKSRLQEQDAPEDHVYGIGKPELDVVDSTAAAKTPGRFELDANRVPAEVN